MTIISDVTGVEFLNSAFLFILILFITQWTISVFAKRTRKISVIEQSRDNDLQNIEVLIFEIRHLCIEYWSQTLNSSEQYVLGHSILARFDFLEILIIRLFGNNQSKRQELLTLLKFFQNQCTGHDFLTNNRKQRPILVRNIENITYTLVDLCVEYRRKLPFEKL